MKEPGTGLVGVVSLSKRFIRFVGVGAFSSLIYVLAVTSYVEVLGIAAKPASLLGYLTAIPVSFFGHRRITFRSSGGLLFELIRFCVLHAANALVAVSAMAWAVDYLGYSYWLGSLAAVVFVPVMTFFVMNWWVFAGPKVKS